jgi:hypothetical protein
MRNFGSKRTAIAERDAQTIRLRAVSGIVANATPAHRVGLTSETVCRRSFRLRSGACLHDANDSLVNFASLTLMGYPDTSGAPSANLRR